MFAGKSEHLACGRENKIKFITLYTCRRVVVLQLTFHLGNSIFRPLFIQSLIVPISILRITPMPACRIVTSTSEDPSMWQRNCFCLGLNTTTLTVESHLLAPFIVIIRGAFKRYSSIYGTVRYYWIVTNKYISLNV
jgi:hypothetical protein